jgi:hypothetical protein
MTICGKEADCIPSGGMDHFGRCVMLQRLLAYKQRGPEFIVTYLIGALMYLFTLLLI